MRRRLAGVGLFALLGLSLVATAGWVPVRRTHPDGSGPLGSLGVPIHDAMRVDPASGDDSWSFGVPLCLASGTASAELEGVRPVAIDGAGFRYLGSAIRSFTWSAVDTPIVSIGGWPPPPAIVADKLSEVDGYGVSTPCQGVVESPQYTELLLGFQRVGPDGGGWAGIYVDYSVDEQQNALQIDHDVMICGTNVSCEPENSG